MIPHADLIIRTDASITVGTGHVMRMVALAQAWQDAGGTAVFVCAEITDPIEQRIRSEQCRVEKLFVTPGSRDDLAATSALAARYAAESPSTAVALDGYLFTADFQLGLKETGCRVLAVDDYGHCDCYHADFVLNQNVSAREDLYVKRDSRTRLLLGSKYALLRREFTDNCECRRVTVEKAGKLLVTLGGADSENVTAKVIDAVADSGLEVKVVVGGSNPHLPSLRRAVAAASVGSARVDLVVNTSDMPELMKWADLAVAAGGSTSWELAYFGVPALFIVLASNQEQSTHELERQGFGICLGEHSQLDPSLLRTALAHLVDDSETRAAFAARGREIVDGLGAARVARALGA
jgi:UDP-2,4-diacetamido-2,4,6-trideoxy-beta-L-altropyranose hydrolase